MESSKGSLLLILLLVTSLSIISGPSHVKAEPILQPHDPIFIGLDSNFTAANGVTGGTGTMSDPFIIENLNITATTTAGIHVKGATATPGVTKYFVIRNVLIHPTNFTTDSSGIVFDNVVHGRLENVQVANFANGISLFGSQNTVTTSTVWNNTNGIILTGSGNILSNNQLNNNAQNGMKITSSTGNLFTGNNASYNANCLVQDERIVNPCDGVGFRVDSSFNNVFENNVAVGNLYDGFRVLFGSNTFRYNNVSKNSNGIDFIDTSGNQAFGNSITNNTIGVWLQGLNFNNNVTLNRLVNNGLGIYVFNSSRNVVYNNYLQNGVNADDDTTQNLWNINETLRPNILGGPITAGNFYSDYHGSDLNGDGIGDTPYTLQGRSVGPNQDRLPLVQNQPSTVRDIAVGPVIVQPTSGRTGVTANVTVTVYNQGTVPESFGVSFSYNQTLINYVPMTTTGLPPLSSALFTLRWSTGALGPATYLLRANASIVQGENYAGNNISPPTKFVLTLNQPPTAQFTVSPTRSVAGTAVNLDALASSDPDGTITSYSWDFGDGNRTITSGKTISHAYSRAGNYTVSLVVTDDEGALSIATTRTLAVLSNIPTEPLNLQITASNGKATLTWSPPSSTGGSPITGYKIYRGTSSSQVTLLTSIGNQTSFTDETISNGQTFYYQITAVNMAGIEGSQSRQQDVLVPKSGAASLPNNQMLWIALAATMVLAVAAGVLVIWRRKIGPAAAKQ